LKEKEEEMEATTNVFEELVVDLFSFIKFLAEIFIPIAQETPTLLENVIQYSSSTIQMEFVASS
jgi:hypothetical protein